MAWADYLGVMDSTSARWLVVAMSLGLGALSWRLVETPFRTGSSLSTPHQAWRGYGVYLVCSGGLGLVLLATQGLSGLWSPAAQSLAASKHDRSHIVECSLEPPPDPLPRLGDEASFPRFLLWGDSHAMALAPLLDTLSKALNTGGNQLTRSSSAPLLRWSHKVRGNSPELSPALQKRWAELALTTIDEEQLSVVFLVGRWEGYSSEGFADTVVATYQAFHARGVHVVFVCSVPTQCFDVPRRLALSTRWKGLDVQPLSLAEYQARNAHVLEAVKRLKDAPGFRVVDPMEVIGQWDSLASEGRCFYRDSHHLSTWGAQQLRPLFQPIFERLVKAGVPQPAEQEAPLLER